MVSGQKRKIMIDIGFQTIGIISVGLLLLSIVLILFKRTKNYAVLVSSLAVLALSYYIINLWIELHRPPLRTLGETRLWYGFFLSFLGVVLWFRWKYIWLFIYSNITASVFLIIDLANPAALDQTLMPALQSVWFVPHVVVYIIGYALLGMSALIAAIRLLMPLWHREIKFNMGKYSMGLLLELGPKRNMGFYHMAYLSIIHTYSNQKPEKRKISFMDSYFFVPVFNDYLAWDTIFACFAKQCPYLLIDSVFLIFNTKYYDE